MTQLSSILSDKTWLKKPVVRECVRGSMVVGELTRREGFHCSGSRAEALSAHVAQTCSDVLQ